MQWCPVFNTIRMHAKKVYVMYYTRLWLRYSPTGAFVPGCLISDNSLVAAELTHYMHKRKSGWNGFMALKLDISKAYDCLEWNFLEAMLLVWDFLRNGFA